MAEEAVVVVEQPVEEKKEVSIQSNPFGSWSETPPEPKVEEIKTDLPPASQSNAEVKTGDEEEILEPKEWLKREFDIEDAAILKAEREELKRLKETPAEYKFENDESKRLVEAITKGDRKTVVQILQTQERLEAYTTAEVTKETAADIIKLGMQLKYKDLTPQEIEYKYNKEFGLPKEPIQKDDELEDDFNIRKAEWQDKVNDIEMTKIIEAKLAKPELEKSKTNLVLPEISKPTATANEPTQEELDNQKRWAENFIQTIESNYSKVEGFSTKVKDESVELPVSFKIPDEDKVALKESFVKGIDVNEYMGKRWFDEKDNPKVEQMILDKYVLENLDKILSGIANKAASERLSAYQKGLKNIDLNKNTHQETFNPEQNGRKVSPFAKDAWSETPPIRN